MLNERMVECLNGQINREIYSAYLYLAMASYAVSVGLRGFANWFTVQVQEEIGHARKIYDYVNRQGARVLLKAIEEPPQDFNSVTDLFERTLEHEGKVTGLINDLVAVAREEHDSVTETFLQWFVTEQVEEEANAAGVLKKLRLMARDDKESLTALDAELARRAFNPA